ncbi:MAG: UDP-N-acetylglucosamine 2-epimerase (non-hydrolyzing) [Candidatus Eisenbacteria bacterium]|nr:UDP-N-acetylglucosamine 2-epimerase (non-hydrolyzing) [Candidatus Eisenbacteria bacterium]
MKVVSVFGTRPEAIKMAPVVSGLSSSKGIDGRVCVTAQHREMLDQVLELFGITPDVDLDIMTNDQSPRAVTARVLEGVDGVLENERPDLVLVHGDTTTTMAAALAAFYRKIPVGHVEAGLRTHDRYYPFPEEMNRVLADALSTHHFAPTAAARRNLIDSGVDPESVVVTGNTVIDALLSTANDPAAPGHGLELEGRVVLVTAHRRENFGEPLASICRALRDVVNRFDDVTVVYPVHLNPSVQRVARELLSGHDRIQLIEPMPYGPFVGLLKASTVVVTDSGGIQEEAPSLGKPVLVLRNETERPEAVEAGTVRLVGTGRDRIVEELSLLLSDENAYRGMAAAVNPYGDGRAAARIVAAIRWSFGLANGERPEEFVPAAGRVV